jgi:hypothetical protein
VAYVGVCPAAYKLPPLILTRHSGVRNPSCDRGFEGVASACKLLFSLRLSLSEQRESDGRDSRIVLESETGFVMTLS